MVTMRSATAVALLLSVAMIWVLQVGPAGRYGHGEAGGSPPAPPQQCIDSATDGDVNEELALHRQRPPAPVVSSFRCFNIFIPWKKESASSSSSRNTSSPRKLPVLDSHYGDLIPSTAADSIAGSNVVGQRLGGNHYCVFHDACVHNGDQLVLLAAATAEAGNAANGDVVSFASFDSGVGRRRDSLTMRPSLVSTSHSATSTTVFNFPRVYNAFKYTTTFLSASASGASESAAEIIGKAKQEQEKLIGRRRRQKNIPSVCNNVSTVMIDDALLPSSHRSIAAGGKGRKLHVQWHGLAGGGKTMGSGSSRIAVALGTSYCCSHPTHFLEPVVTMFAALRHWRRLLADHVASLASGASPSPSRTATAVPVAPAVDALDDAEVVSTVQLLGTHKERTPVGAWARAVLGAATELPMSCNPNGTREAGSDGGGLEVVTGRDTLHCYRRLLVPSSGYYLFHGFDEATKAAFTEQMRQHVAAADVSAAGKSPGAADDGSGRGLLTITIALRKSRRVLINGIEFVERVRTWASHHFSDSGTDPAATSRRVDVHRVFLGDMTPAAQAALLARTDVFASLHGADLTNMIFLRRGASVIELNPLFFFEGRFAELARTLGLHYFAWTCTDLVCGDLGNRKLFTTPKFLPDLQVSRSPNDHRLLRNVSTAIITTQPAALPVTAADPVRVVYDAASAQWLVSNELLDVDLLGTEGARFQLVKKESRDPVGSPFLWPAVGYPGATCAGCGQLGCCTSLSKVFLSRLRDSNVMLAERHLWQIIEGTIRPAVAAVLSSRSRGEYQ